MSSYFNFEKGFNKETALKIGLPIVIVLIIIVAIIFYFYKRSSNTPTTPSSPNLSLSVEPITPTPTFIPITTPPIISSQPIIQTTAPIMVSTTAAPFIPATSPIPSVITSSPLTTVAPFVSSSSPLTTSAPLTTNAGSFSPTLPPYLVLIPSAISGAPNLPSGPMDLKDDIIFNNSNIDKNNQSDYNAFNADYNSLTNYIAFQNLVTTACNGDKNCFEPTMDKYTQDQTTALQPCNDWNTYWTNNNWNYSTPTGAQMYGARTTACHNLLNENYFKYLVSQYSNGLTPVTN